MIRSRAAVLLVAMLAGTSAAAQPPRSQPPRPRAPLPTTTVPPDQPKPNKARLFPPQDLGLLEPPDRDQWQKPDQIMDALLIAEGSVVAEVGAGGGWFTPWLSRRVGPNGRIYAEDIQTQMIEEIVRRVRRENLSNVVPVLGTPQDPRLPDGLDAVLIVNSYHELEDPADPQAVVTLFKNIARSLKSQGRVGVVDFTAGAGGPGPSADERVDPQTVIKTAAEAGLQLIKREAVQPFEYLLAFGKP